MKACKAVVSTHPLSASMPDFSPLRDMHQPVIKSPELTITTKVCVEQSDLHSLGRLFQRWYTKAVKLQERSALQKRIPQKRCQSTQDVDRTFCHCLLLTTLYVGNCDNRLDCCQISSLTKTHIELQTERRHSAWTL